MIGIPTAKVAVEFARRCGLDLPIFNAVYLVIAGDLKIEVIVGRNVFMQQNLNLLRINFIHVAYIRMHICI